MAALVEVVRGRRLSPIVTVGAVVLVAVGAVTLVGNLRSYHQEVVQYKHSTWTFMVAVEAIPDRIDRHRIMPLSYNIVRAGEYLAAVEHLGSPVAGVGLRDLGSETDRKNADGWMIHDLALGVVPGPAPSTGSCTTVDPAEERDVRVHGRGAVVAHAGPAPAVLFIRRLADNFETPIGQLPPGVVGVLRIPADHSSLPWHIRLDGVGATLSVCR